MIIGLSAKMGVGKSTLANLIKEQTTREVRIVKNAALIYEMQDMIYAKLGMTLVGEKDRPLLIALGMWGRDIDPDFWAKKAMEEALRLEKEGYLVIIDDVRFPNEAKLVEEHGILIRINGQQRGPNVTESAKTNPTETALDDYPFENIIENKYDEPYLLAMLEDVVYKYHGIID